MSQSRTLQADVDHRLRGRALCRRRSAPGEAARSRRSARSPATASRREADGRAKPGAGTDRRPAAGRLGRCVAVADAQLRRRTPRSDGRLGAQRGQLGRRPAARVRTGTSRSATMAGVGCVRDRVAEGEHRAALAVLGADAVGPRAVDGAEVAEPPAGGVERVDAGSRGSGAALSATAAQPRVTAWRRSTWRARATSSTQCPCAGSGLDPFACCKIPSSPVMAFEVPPADGMERRELTH